MTEQPLALWAEITIAALVLLGATIALIGSLGLLRLKDYYERVHAPSMIATMGCWSIMHATVLFFSLQGHGFAAYPLLIAVFVAITVPVTNIFLMRAALFRARRSGQNVPASVSQTVPPTVETQIDHS